MSQSYKSAPPTVFARPPSADRAINPLDEQRLYQSSGDPQAEWVRAAMQKFDQQVAQFQPQQPSDLDQALKKLNSLYDHAEGGLKYDQKGRNEHAPALKLGYKSTVVQVIEKHSEYFQLDIRQTFLKYNPKILIFARLYGHLDEHAYDTFEQLPLETRRRLMVMDGPEIDNWSSVLETALIAEDIQVPITPEIRFSPSISPLVQKRLFNLAKWLNHALREKNTLINLKLDLGDMKGLDQGIYRFVFYHSNDQESKPQVLIEYLGEAGLNDTDLRTTHQEGQKKLKESYNIGTLDDLDTNELPPRYRLSVKPWTNDEKTQLFRVLEALPNWVKESIKGTQFIRGSGRNNDTSYVDPEGGRCIFIFDQAFDKEMNEAIPERAGVNTLAASVIHEVGHVVDLGSVVGRQCGIRDDSQDLECISKSDMTFNKKGRWWISMTIGQGDDFAAQAAFADGLTPNLSDEWRVKFIEYVHRYLNDSAEIQREQGQRVVDFFKNFMIELEKYKGRWGKKISDEQFFDHQWKNYMSSSVQTEHEEDKGIFHLFKSSEMEFQKIAISIYDEDLMDLWPKYLLSPEFALKYMDKRDQYRRITEYLRATQRSIAQSEFKRAIGVNPGDPIDLHQLISITKYGRKNWMECWAEFFRIYIEDPKLLERIDKDVYEYFDSLKG